MASSNELHQLIKKKRWEKVMTRINLYPEEVKEEIKQRFNCGTEIICLPLHSVCMRCPPLGVVMSMMAAYLDSAKIKDSKGRLPIHHACRYGASFGVVLFLLEKYPDGAKVPTEVGCLPIHTACLFGSSSTIVSTLLEVYPESVEKADLAGLTPSDYAEDNPRPVKQDIITLLDSAILRLDSRNRLVEQKTEPIPEIPFKAKSQEGDSQIQQVNDQQVAAIKRRSSTKLCVVCMDRDVCRILLPCGHPCLCDKCSESSSMIRMGQRCPECRRDVEGVVAFYGRVVND